MLIAVAFVFMIYVESDMSAPNNPKSLEKSISRFTLPNDIQAKVVQIDKRGNELVVSFTDERYPDFIGIARFQSVFNLLWNPVDISYGNYPSIGTHRYHEEDGTIKNIIYGVNSDPRISYFNGTYFDQGFEREIVPEQDVIDPNFIRYYDIEEHINLNFFDSDRNNITLEFYKELDHSGPTERMSWRNKSGNLGMYFIILMMALLLAFFFWRSDSNSMRYYEESVRQEEKKEAQGFVNKLKDLSLRKKITLVILVVSILAVGTLYPLCFSASLSEESLTKSIEKYMEDDNVTLLKTEKDGKNLIALYKTDKHDAAASIALFERGIIGRWALARSDSQTDICISSFGYYYYDESYHFIVTGTNCDPRAVSYEYDFEHPYDTEMEPINLYSSNITESNFIHIYKMGNYWTTVPKIYDSNGENIEPELTERYWAENNDTWEGYSTIELGISSINSLVVFAIVVNLIALWAVWIEKPKKMKKK